MVDVIITGASRGIGRALALELAQHTSSRLVLSARNESALETTRDDAEQLGARVVTVPGDLGSLPAATALGRALTRVVDADATLVHNAGMWPARCERNDSGLERSFVVNHLGPLAMQAPLLAAKRIKRIMLVSAGLIIKGRFDAAKTPTGDDFSSVRTYCNTKLALAIAMREIAARHPDIDVVVLHPGVVRTELGARSGPLGWMLSLVKRGWESPTTCAKRLASTLQRDRWSPPGEARWLVLEEEQPWPPNTIAPATIDAVRACTSQLLPEWLGANAPA